MIEKTVTACCALAQLSGLNNNTSLAEIGVKLGELKPERDDVYVPGDNSGLGQTSYFVITTPNEKLLRSRLKLAGFDKIHSFKRRKGYPKGKLKMYAINI